MISITVTGSTFDISGRLKDNLFRWNPKRKAWHRVVGEASLNRVVEALRPMRSWSEHPTPNIIVKLQSVDVHNNPLNDKVMCVKLMPEGESSGADFREILNDVSNYHHNLPEPLYSEPDSLDCKRKSLEGFY